MEENVDSGKNLVSSSVSYALPIHPQSLCDEQEITVQKPPSNAPNRSILILVYLIYILSPIDLITDLIPIAGWIDDAVVASLLASEVAALVQDRRSDREAAAKGESTDEC